MENFKIELFEKENPSSKFPSFSSLDAEGTTRVRQQFTQKLKVDKHIDGKELLNLLLDKTEAIKAFNANVDSFNIADVFRYLDLLPNETIYINWYHFDDIDVMGYNDFCKYFEYVWFPGPDDIDVFDDTYSWVLSINHEGDICCRGMLEGNLKNRGPKGQISKSQI